MLKSSGGVQMTTRSLYSPPQSEVPPFPPNPATPQTISLDTIKVDSAANPLGSYTAPQLQKTVAFVLINTNTVFTVHVVDRILIGRRDPESNEKIDIDLLMYGGREKGVSRCHAALHRSGHLLSIVDLTSTNGTYLNGVRLLPALPHGLRDGDEICLGKMLFHIHFAF
jgi:hypothetical protein